MLFKRSYILKNIILIKIIIFLLNSSQVANFKKIAPLYILKRKKINNSYIDNVCYISGKERSISKNLRMNRNSINRLLIKNKIPGLRSSSW